jgi:cytochrome c oxidase accessory protein FixG
LSGTERLSSIDEDGARKHIIPAEVQGVLRSWRTAVHAVLLIVFIVLPWIKINGLQALLLDIPARRFEVFGTLFLSHDAPLVFFILIILVLILAVVTALWGRVWCGWACPQTVFIDAIYRRIEIWVVGGYLERRKLVKAPMSITKFRKTTLKWILFFIVSSLIAHSFVAYFVGGTKLIEMMRGSPSENWSYFVIVSLSTLGLLFNFGWFREQFCIIMCPYGRLQSALMDQNTVTVMYDEKRGEPRKGVLNPANLRGDCVSCNRCVEVCPTAIDIRNGIQMECIACTACIDACNAIMRKVNKPEGLIRHKRISEVPKHRFSPKLAVYLVLGVFSLVGLTYSLGTREPFSITILRAQDTPYQNLPGGSVLNHFKVHIMNQSLQPQEFEISLSDDEIKRDVRLTQGKPIVSLQEGGASETHLFVIFPKNLFDQKGEAHLAFRVRELKTGQTQSIEVTAVGPYAP